MPSDTPPVTLESPAATAAFARRLAPTLGAGHVLLLSGEIGAGKSHFARALIGARLEAAGTPEDIPSPTYTLVQSYTAGALAIWHCDLYRLGDPEEAVELGLWEAFDTALCLVEWPERLGDAAPEAALSLAFSDGAHAEERRLRLAPISAAGARLYGLACAALPACETTP